MKKIWKKFSLAFALVMCVTLATPAMSQSISSVFADGEGYTQVLNYLQIKGFSNSGEVGKKCYVTPTISGAASTAGMTVETTVVDQNGTNPTVQTDANGSYFVPTNPGLHTVTYTVKNGGIVVATKDFYVDVKNNIENYSLALKTNDSKLIPSKAKVGAEVSFPDILVLDAEGDVIDLPTGTKIITECNENSAWDATNKKLTIGSTVGKTYTVTYKLVDEANEQTVYAYKSVEVEAVSADYKFDYTFTYSTTQPTSGTVGTEITLPGITATNTVDSSNIAVSYDVKITHNNVEYNKTNNKVTVDGEQVEILTQNEYGEFIFTPFDEGRYDVAYEITAYGNGTCKTDGKSFTISNVTTTSTPEIMVTATGANYGVMNAVEALATTWVNADYVVLPIYATDSASELLGKDNIVMYRQIVNNSTQKTIFDEQQYYETLNETSLADLNKKALILNPSNDYAGSTIYVEGEAVSIATADAHKVTTYNSTALNLAAGKYTVKYIAKDVKSGETATLSYTFEIVAQSSITAKSSPTSVTFDSETAIPTTMLLGNSITFGEPEASQDQQKDDDGNITNYADERLTTVVSYKLSTDGVTFGNAISISDPTSWITFDEDTNKYTLNIPEDTNNKAIQIIATTTNDFGNTKSETKTISLLASEDETPTTVDCVVLTNVNWENEYIQNTEIVLPTVTYNDNMPNAVNLEISIFDANGNSYDASAYTTSISGNNKTFENATFTPAEVGTYTITYVSSDKGNNLTVLVFTVDIAVNPAEFKANFVNLPSTLTSGDIEVNAKITLPDISVSVSHPTAIYADDWKIALVEGTSNLNSNETEIWFTKTGTYKVQFVCDVNNSSDNSLWNTIESEIYTITVVDTTAPTVENKTAIDTAMLQMKTMDYSSEGTFSLPLPLINDDLQYSSVKITTTTLSETIKLDGTNPKAKLTNLKISDYLSNNDTATVTYSIKDKTGNETTLTYTIEVGDVTPPVITITNDNNKYLAKSYSFVDGQVNFKIDLNMISLSDKEDGEDLLYKDNGVWKLKSGTLAITVTNTSTAESTKITSTTGTPSTNQTSASDLEYSYTLTTAGEYQIIISYTDTANKTSTNSSLTFQVVDPAADALSTETILGIVLIVVSVLILGGVVTYFVVTRNKYKTKR